MYAKVVTFQVKPGKQDEAIHLFKDVVVPAAVKQKGFKGGILLTDKKTGKNISIGLWKTETDIEASETGGFYQEWVSKFREVFALPPSREIYEVTNLSGVSVQ